MALSIPGLTRLQVDTTTSSFLDRSSGQWAVYQRSLQLFGGDEFVTILVEGGRPYSAAALRRVAEVSKGLRDAPGVRRVDSISTVPVIDDQAGRLVVRPLAPGDIVSRNAIDLRSLVQSNPIARGNLVSRDGKSFAVNALLDSNVDGARDRLVELLSRLTEDTRVAAISGVPVFRTRVNQRTSRELAVLVPGATVVLLVLLVLFFRAGGAILANLSCPGVGLVVVLGLMGFLGIPVSLATMTVPPILLGLGSAYSTHVVAAMRRSDGDPRAALVSVGRPVALSGLTTSLGFLAMGSVRVDAIQELGAIGAIGSLVVSAAALTLVPTVLRGVRFGQVGGFDAMGRWCAFASIGAIRRPIVVVLIWVLAAAGAGSGLSRLDIDTDIISWFPKGDPVRSDYERIREAFSGITPVNVTLEAIGEAPVITAQGLSAIDRLTRFFDSKVEVGSVVSITSLFRYVGQSFFGTDSLPSTGAGAEQYLGILGSGDYVAGLISEDRRAANVVIRMNVNGSDALLGVEESVRRWWEQHGDGTYQVSMTGIMFEFARAQQAIAIGQIRGLIVALAVVMTVLIFVLRSIRIAVLAAIPNVLPVLITFGLVGWLGVSLDAASACIGAVALGIAVDDTIHVAARYRQLRGDGVEPRLAAEETILSTCPSLVCTTVLISTSFAILGVSSFAMVSHFGVITAVVVALCLVADVTLLPVLLIFGDRDQGAAGSG